MPNYTLETSQNTETYWYDSDGNPILDESGDPIITNNALYRIIPQSFGLFRSYPISVESSSYSKNGTASDLLKLFNLTNGLGSYIYSGKVISTEYHRKLSLALGEYVKSGTENIFTNLNGLAADTALYFIIGADVRFIPIVFLVTTGQYQIDGTDSDLLYLHLLSGETEDYTLTGVDVNLYEGWFITDFSGSYEQTGFNAELFTGNKIIVADKAFIVTGLGSDLKYLHKLGIDSSFYTYDGIDSDLLELFNLTGGIGEFIKSGEVVTLNPFYQFISGEGSLTLTGESINFGTSFVISPEIGIIIYTGNILGLYYSAEIVGNVLAFFNIKSAKISLEVKNPQIYLVMKDPQIILTLK